MVDFVIGAHDDNLHLWLERDETDIILYAKLGSCVKKLINFCPGEVPYFYEVTDEVAEVLKIGQYQTIARNDELIQASKIALDQLVADGRFDQADALRRALR